MSAYTNVPTLEANLLAPASVSVDVMGSSVSGGRNAVGESQTIEMSGGGLLTATYSDCKLTVPEQYEYVNYLGARFNGGFRFLNVPIISDWYGPFPIVNGITRAKIGGIRHSDGTLHSDGTGYSQRTVRGVVAQTAGLNAGILKIRMFGLARPLRWSDWFSINHPTKGWRAYRQWEVLDVTAEENPVYTLALSMPLREATPLGTDVEFVRPRFVAKFKDGFTLPSVVEAFFVTQQTIQFSEAF